MFVNYLLIFILIFLLLHVLNIFKEKLENIIFTKTESIHDWNDAARSNLLSVIYFFMLQELLEYFRMSLYKILTKRIRWIVNDDEYVMLRKLDSWN